MRFAYLIGSAGVVLIWLAFWFQADTARRKVMLQVSAITGLTGFAEPLFMSVYWDPPSVFDLNDRIGFDIESVVFTFAGGGIAAAIYTVLRKMSPITASDRRCSHPFQIFALLVPIPVFVVVVATTNMNPIYITIVALFAGAAAACLCWPGLIPKIFVTGLLFMGLYFAGFVTFNAVFPHYIPQVWNMGALTGVMVTGVPLEELLFAFSYGLMYSNVAEYFFARIAVHRADEYDLT